jgi:hypothetical protein
VVVEECGEVGERARLEHVLEVGVPEPDAREPGARRLRAAVLEVEETPLAAGVHVDRSGSGPVERHEVGVGRHPRRR